MSEISVANIVSISVMEAPVGLEEYNVNNLALFTSQNASSSLTDNYKVYITSQEVEDDFGTSSIVTEIAQKIFGQSPNILVGGGRLVVYTTNGTTLDNVIESAITSLGTLASFTGILTDTCLSSTTALEVAEAVQATNRLFFCVQKDSSYLAAGELFEQIVDATYDRTRSLLRIKDNSTSEEAVKFAAAYASRAMAVNFDGVNTTSTVHMKTLKGITSDSSLDQTILTNTIAQGVDCYPSFRGVAKVHSSGANKFFDQVYNLTWLVGALEVAGFNAIATVSTKLPQTEDGVGVLKSFYREILDRAVRIGYLAGGEWTSPDTFGNPDDFRRNIEERGYYIYSVPVNQQSTSDRDDRKAPVISIAAKESGAIHSTEVMVYVNA